MVGSLQDIKLVDGLATYGARGRRWYATVGLSMYSSMINQVLDTQLYQTMMNEPPNMEVQRNIRRNRQGNSVNALAVATFGRMKPYQ